ncbi:hypothetical protein LC609_21565 [Nostoc sp. XA013]|nr:hypothetical protein [Nostoc sp. XA013]
MSLEKENHLKQEDEKYSFKTLGGNSQNFYLTLDEKGEPIKLGDGTFGIVFAFLLMKTHQYVFYLV